MARERFEQGDTVQFTWQSSVAPDAAPSFAVITASETVINSQTSVQSGSLQYFAMVTMSMDNTGPYVAEWRAAKTVNAIAYPFVKRFVFKVEGTLVPLINDL